MKKRFARTVAAILSAAALMSGAAYATGEDGETSGTEAASPEETSPEETKPEETDSGEINAGETEKALEEALEKSLFAEDEVIADGVYIDQINVSGMTAKEALRAVLAYVEETEKKTMTVTLEGADEVEPIRVTAKELGLRTDDLAEIVMKALALGKGGNLIARYKAEADLKVSNQVYEIGLAVDPEEVSRFVAEQTGSLSVDPVDAVLTRTGDGFSVSESRTGIKVDVPATVSAVQETFRDWNREDVTVGAVAEITRPKYTSEMLSQIQDPLGQFSTGNSDRSGGKLQNVQRGVDLTTGILIMPGESWSMHDALAPFTAENGYTMQIAYQGNSYVKEYGGGICQLATTLYNAALRAEVNISKRSNHSMVVGYTKWGLDATINDGGSKDLELTNDFDFPIYIEAVHNGSGKVTYTIWGKETRPAGRTLEFTNEILSEEYLPDEVSINPGLAPGEERKLESGYPKATVEAYKEIYENGILMDRIRLHTDKYLAKAKKIERGPDVPVDPGTGLPAGTDPSGGQPADPNAGQPQTPPATEQTPPATEQTPPATEPSTEATEAPPSAPEPVPEA